MSLFEMSNKQKLKDPVAAQKDAETAVKAKLTDDVLGLNK